MVAAEHERDKARDAVIVAIGIVAVLIVNVAYVGYLTPPGAGQYWTDCDYPAFVAYICLNGFALVFSIAAIAAVTFGPLMLMQRQPWRKQVVSVGLAHLVLSLLALLGAFACAGFILALVDAPDFNCANLKCSEGGVPCSPYRVRWRNDTRDVPGSFLDLRLDPQVVALNKDAFEGLAPGSSEVLCQDYAYLAITSSALNGLPVNASNGTAALPGDICMYLLSNTTFNMRPLGNANYTELGPADRTWRLKKPHALTLWCAPTRAQVGPGWLPLTSKRAFALLDAMWPGGSGAAKLVTKLSDARGAQCQSSPAWDEMASVSLWNGKVKAVSLLRDTPNPWRGDGRASYDFERTNAQRRKNTFTYILRRLAAAEKAAPSLEPVEAARKYAYGLGCDGIQALFCPEKIGTNVDEDTVPKECRYNRYLNAKKFGAYHPAFADTDDRPLRQAKLYASLRYQCSGLERGVLCDYGVSPPLAVDQDRKYLNKKMLPEQNHLILYGKPLQATEVDWAVRWMIIGIVASNAVSAIVFACSSKKAVA